MSAVAAAGPGALGASARRARPRDVLRVETAKLRSQLLTRLALATCIIGPLAFTAIMKTQSTLPADTLFGRWLHSSGFAVPFVMLGFGGEGALIVLASIVAGDIFASEDRYGTWQTLLTRGCRRGDVFVGKVLAAAVYSILVVVLLAVSSLVAGLLLVGSQPVIGLSGTLLPAGHAVVLVVASWATMVLPMLAFTSIGVLFSAASRSSVIGVIGPVVVGLLMELLAVLGFRTLMLTTAFDAWHGLLVAPPRLGPLVQGSIASVVYIGVCLGLAWLIVRRRDFAGPVPEGRPSERGQRARVGAAALAAVIILGAASYRPSPITSASLQTAIATGFRHLVAVKQGQTGQPVVIQQQVLDRHALAAVRTTCRRGGQTGPGQGPGDDWVCVVSRGTGPNALSFAYDVNAKANGCYTAEGPSSILGPLRILDARYQPIVNPLFQFDGCLGTP